jgi:ribose 1,5-bisphosphokinase PhnN
MSGMFILNKIREHFPDMAENIDITHLNNSGNIQHYLNMLASQIPNMPFDHMHRMC